MVEEDGQGMNAKKRRNEGKRKNERKGKKESVKMSLVQCVEVRNTFFWIYVRKWKGMRERIKDRKEGKKWGNYISLYKRRSQKHFILDLREEMRRDEGRRIKRKEGRKKKKRGHCRKLIRNHPPGITRIKYWREEDSWAVVDSWSIAQLPAQDSTGSSCNKKTAHLVKTKPPVETDFNFFFFRRAVCGPACLYEFTYRYIEISYIM